MAFQSKSRKQIRLGEMLKGTGVNKKHTSFCLGLKNRAWDGRSFWHLADNSGEQYPTYVQYPPEIKKNLTKTWRTMLNVCVCVCVCVCNESL